VFSPNPPSKRKLARSHPHACAASLNDKLAKQKQNVSHHPKMLLKIMEKLGIEPRTFSTQQVL
jgi:hypothetical protein